MRITHWDLFAGIGGFAYSLRGIAKTTLYCEREEFQKRVLLSAMDKGYLHKGRIVNDIEEVYKEKQAPDLMTAGWPCQNISLLGDGTGLRGEKSGLIWTLLKIVKKYLPSMVVLENVACIKTNGMKEILTALNEMGYAVAWGIFSASDVGGLHLRRRWYCVAMRPGREDIAKTLCNLKITHHNWAKESTKRECDKDPVNTRRCMALGNAIVPQCAQRAIAELSKYLICKPNGPRASKKNPPSHGIIIKDGACYEIDIIASGHTSDAKLHIAPCKYKHRHTEDCVLSPICKSKWPTPCASRSSWVPAERFTKRRLTELATVVAQEVQTRKPMLAVSPVWVEWLMGYPKNYTTPKQ